MFGVFLSRVVFAGALFVQILAAQPKALADISIVDAVAAYLCENESSSHHTNKARRADLNLFAAHVSASGVETMRALTSAHLKSFAAARATVEAPTTATRRIWIVSSFCRWVRAEHPELRDVTFGIKTPKSPAVPPLGFQRHEVDAMKASCADSRDLAVIEVLHRTGIRQHELVRLDWRNLDLVRWYLVDVTAKHFRYLDKPLHESARRALLAYLPIRDELLRESGVGMLPPELRGRFPLFVSNYRTVAGEPESYRLSDKTVWGIVRRAGERAGVSDAHPHRLRHTAAIEFYRQTNDLALTAQYMGHANLSSTSRYLIRNPNEIESAIERIP